METASRTVKSGASYDHFFPKARLTEVTVKKNADLTNTMNFIPKVVRETAWQTNKIAPVLKGSNVHETCSKIWHFVYDHINYRKDEQGTEQIRSPARLWHDKIGDCDCYTVFISSILYNLEIPHKYRVTKYKQDKFQHIYPIVPLPDGSHITIDCVVHQFNYEEPYTEKIDKKMELQYLNGVDDENTSPRKQHRSIDDSDMFGLEGDMGELGRLFKRRPKGTAPKPKGGFFKKVGNTVKKGLNVVNKINPATVLLRNGLLASMKLNIMKIAQKLKWAYLTDEQARQKGIIPDRHKKLKQVMKKLEGIFYTAGGKPENLKKAILTGKGNRNKEVSGLGYVMPDEITLNEYNINTPLPTLLGEMYYSEIEGLGELGEPVTAASIAAATTALATIAGIIKSIGNIFPKGKGAAQEFEETAGDASADAAVVQAAIASGETIPDSNDSGTSTPALRTAGDDSSSDTSGDSGGGDTKEGFWDKNKKWIVPTAIGVGSIGAIALAVKAFKPAPVKALSGVPKRRKRRATTKKKGGKITPLALM